MKKSEGVQVDPAFMRLLDRNVALAKAYLEGARRRSSLERVNIMEMLIRVVEATDGKAVPTGGSMSRAEKEDTYGPELC